MITSDRRCDVCFKRALCRCTGTLRWLCSLCWAQLVDLPWEVRS